MTEGVKAFKESHEKDVERLAADRRREAESKEAHALKNAPKHTVLCMKGLTSPVWTLGMFQMVSGDSCQCMKRTKQSTAQNTSNLENHYVTAGTDCAQSVYSCVRLRDMKTDMKCVVQSKV